MSLMGVLLMLLASRGSGREAVGSHTQCDGQTSAPVGSGAADSTWLCPLAPAANLRLCSRCLSRDWLGVGG